MKGETTLVEKFLYFSVAVDPNNEEQAVSVSVEAKGDSDIYS